MISLYNEYNETGDYQAFISAKECGNNKDNFLKVLKEELMDDNIELAGEVEEGYYRIKGQMNGREMNLENIVGHLPRKEEEQLYFIWQIGNLKRRLYNVV